MFEITLATWPILHKLHECYCWDEYMLSSKNQYTKKDLAIHMYCIADNCWLIYGPQPAAFQCSHVCLLWPATEGNPCPYVYTQRESGFDGY